MVLRVVFWGLPGFWRRVGCMCDYVVLPLLNSSFEPGRAREVVEGFVDVDLRNMVCAPSSRQLKKYRFFATQIMLGSIFMLP